MTTNDLRAGRSVYRFEFNPGTDMGSVEDTLLLAILSVGCLHGQAAVRLDAGYALDHDTRTMVVDASTPVGRDVTRVFAGLCAHEFGDLSFRVDAVQPDAHPANEVAA